MSAACYLSSMLTRALWTSLLALLAWLPFGRGQAVLARGERGTRVIVASYVFDGDVDAPGRVVRPAWAAPHASAQRRATPPDGLPTVASLGGRRPASSPRAHARQIVAAWRGFRAKCLIVPHDATAPPGFNR